jgi:penicillin amidase
MSLIRRVAGLIAKLLVIVLVIAFVAGTGLVTLVTIRGLPQTSGTLQAKGLGAPVTVVRDATGIIQITADSPHDLFLAQGYVHAQERMWQMEISRRIGAGRLSELFGKAEISTDTYIRTLGLRVAAQRDLDAMSPASRALIQAYAEGVNDWINQHDGSLSMPFVVSGFLSGSGSLGGFHLEPWTPRDTATWQKVQALSLGKNMDAEIFRLIADARLGDPAKTDALFPAYDANAPVITPTGLPGSGGTGSRPILTAGSPTVAATAATALTAEQQAGLASLAADASQVTSLAGFDSAEGMIGSHGVGSNDWVIAGSLSASGKPILANDPHLGYGMPSVWIMNGLHCRVVSAACPWDVAGVSFPGAPAVILGHNANIAWGATNAGPDTQDLFVETPDPKDPSHYLYKGASLPYDIRIETIKVAGGPDVQVIVRSTVHGPIMNGADRRLIGAPLLALRWTTTAEVDLALETFFKIDVATTFDEFRAAFAGYGSPSQNFVYADVNGHIGYVLPGLIPIRNGVRTGDRVRDGASGKDDWAGYIPRDKLPWQLDPPSGVIVSANNAAVDSKYPYWLGRDWDPGYRAARIKLLIETDKKPLTAADMRAIQTDTYVLRANTIVPLLAGLHAQPATADGQALLSRILAWDQRCDVGSLGCAAYMATEFNIERSLFDARLGSIARDYVGSTESWQALIALLAEPTNDWWDDPATPARETAPSIVAAALDRTGAQLRAAFGDPKGWTWGSMHQVAFREGTLGSSGIGPLEWYFNSPARPVSGASGAVDNTYYQLSRAYPDPLDPSYKPVGIDHVFDVTNGPSYRLTIDMADLDGARIVITTGQSGNPFDRHYGDLIGSWANGDTVLLPFSPAAIASSAVATLTLTP